MNYPKNRYTGPKPWMNYEWLYNEYVIKDRSTQDIADEYNCKQNTIQCWLTKHHIKKDLTKPHQTYDYLYYHYIVLHETKDQIAETAGVSVRVISSYLRQYGIKIWDHKINNQEPYSKEEIEDILNLYINQKMSSPQIAKIYNTSHRSILNCLKRHNIDRRTLSEAQFSFNKKEFISALNDKELLYTMHWIDNLSCKEIGQKIGCDAGCVRRHMHALGLRTKNNAESKIGQMVGPNHPNWKGGITPLNLLLREYFHTNIAPLAAKRDKYTCCLCGKQHTILHVHHLYPFSNIIQDICKEHPELDLNVEKDRSKLYIIAVNDQRFLDIDNLQTLCVDCHHKQHSKTISNQAYDEES